jgi:hypothetical protein
MALYPTFLEIKKILAQLPVWLDKAAAVAAAKKFEPNTLLQARLAPDMFPLVRQIQAACDQVKFAGGRATGKDIPSHPDTEQTFDELRARIAAVLAYAEGFSAKDFEGATDRTISLPRWEGKSLSAEAYFLEHALPNFFFHISMTYAILRHNGVDIGKRDFLGALSFR